MRAAIPRPGTFGKSRSGMPTMRYVTLPERISAQWLSARYADAVVRDLDDAVVQREAVVPGARDIGAEHRLAAQIGERLNRAVFARDQRREVRRLALPARHHERVRAALGCRDERGRRHPGHVW